MRREMTIGLACAFFVAAAMGVWTACGGEDDGESGPAVPHSVTSTDDAYCLNCHKDGINGAPQSPHPDRADCTGCHKVTAGNDVGTGGAGAPSIPHDVTATDAASCLACHKDGAGGAPKTTHADRSACTDCHQRG